jgi:hypothetical protein
MWKRFVALPACVTLLSFGCSSSSQDEAHGVGDDAGGSGGITVGGTGGAAASGGTGAIIGAGGSGAIIGVGGTGSGTGATSGASGTGNGAAELCDGIDNDGNGVIDDVDAGGDGVCDCLNIGTLGHIGPWSNGGNIFATWLNARTPRGAVELGDQVLTPELLAPLNIIVTLHVHTEAVSNMGVTAPAVHAYSEAEASAFQGWVHAGGGVMSTIGYSGNEAAEIVNVNRLLGSVGMGYSTANFDLSNFVTTWDPHPVTDGVRNIYTDNGVEPAGTGTVVARGESDRAALEVIQSEKGRIVVWGDEWITYDSEWQDVEDQQIELFWLNILKWLSPPGECQVPIPPDIPR